ncbi:MAG: formate dehydrogenase subunit gamma [Rhodosalinus sp.]
MALDTAANPRLARLEAILDAHDGREGPLLPILHDVQAAFGCVPAEVVPRIADRLNLTRAEVHGVVSFYHDFREVPAGRVVVKLCRSEACKATGADALAAAAEARTGVAMGETAADGSLTLEPVYCLGLCACGPAAMVDGTLVGRLDADRLDAMLSERGL